MDVLVRDGKIARVAETLAADNVTVLDLKGKIVAPGFIDMHVHLREPGREDEETMETGSAAAAAGGFTSIAVMPNTDPWNDSQSVTEYIVSQARSRAVVNVFPIGCISKQGKGEELAEIGDMVKSGVVAVSDDGHPVSSGHLMRMALEYTKIFDLAVIDHCEERSLSAGGVMHEGFTSTVLGLRGIPAAAEEIMVARDVVLAEATGGRIHIAHLSCRGSLELVRRARERGVRVTAEVTPHHFALTDADVARSGYDTNTKMNPPLRAEEDRDAMLQGLADGTLDAIASDHAPHNIVEKSVEFDQAPFGIVGLETSVPLALDRLVRGKVVDLRRLISLYTTGPARILNLERGTLAPGAVADVTVLDLDKEVTVDSSTQRSKSRNAPYQGWKLRGAPILTMVGGRIVFDARS
ncbi:MAG TPA: dihydroorotase [Candidatus Polarisedimenticolia bacterium]|nr:dihydroorotase [Candidatus Polarisedimenticolia bacterium]